MKSLQRLQLILARAVRGHPYADRLRQLSGQAEVVEPTETPRVVPDDSEDDKLMAAALAADAVLVTNDGHLLAVTGYQGLRVMRPAELARLWTEDRRMSG